MSPLLLRRCLAVQRSLRELNAAVNAAYPDIAEPFQPASYFRPAELIRRRGVKR